MATTCSLCTSTGGLEILRSANWRVVVATDEPLYPALCRVIWNAHVREMSDLAPAARAELLQALMRTEAALLEVVRPAKINLASLGNMTPHLHWHVVPRFAEDAHFPNAIWGPQRRAAEPVPLPSDFVERMRAALEKTP